MNWSVTIPSTVSSDTEPTIVLNFDSAKYVFNAGENTNRAFLQSPHSWRKARGMFLTSIGTQRASGLSGLLMTFADSGIGKLHITGPPGLAHFLAAMRLYTFRDTMSINVVEMPASAFPFLNSERDPEPVYKDGLITVYALPIVPSSTSTIEVPILEASAKRKRTISPDSPSKRSVLDNSRDSSASTSPPSAWSPSTPIQELLRRRSFSPKHLVGTRAEEWRRAIIAAMLTGEKANMQDETKSDQRDFVKEDGKVRGGTKNEGKSAKSRGKVKATQRGPRHEGSDQMRPMSAQDFRPDDEMLEDFIEASSPMKTEQVRVPAPPGFSKQLPPFPSPPYKHTLAYIVIGPRTRGKFDAAKAEELGLPKGYLRAELTRGKTVSFQVSDGHGRVLERVVRPEDVIGESETPGAVLILDTPSRGHIQSLASSFTDGSFFGRFRSKQDKEVKDFPVRVVFHLCGDGVLEDQRYKSFMSGFGHDVHHLVASREHGADPVTFTSAAFNQLKFNQLDPEVFPLPKFSLQQKDMSSISGLPPRVSLLQANVLVKIRPPQPPMHEKEADDMDHFHPIVRSSVPLSLPEHIMECFSEAKAKVLEQNNSRSLSRAPGDEVVVVTLGTGSAVPTKYRNMSGTFIQIPKWGNILLDAGEGTWGQLHRQYGDGVWQVLRDLKCIFISHMHGDHHIGVPKILAMRRQLDPPATAPLYLVTHRPILMYLHEYADIEDLGLNDSSGNGVIPVLSDRLRTHEGTRPSGWGPEPWMDAEKSQRASEEMCRTLGLERFTTVDVEHRTRCFGAVIKHLDGWSIVFSGDTMPSERLVKEGQDATLLIHEATMADNQAAMAFAKAHSTFSQAVDIGKRMNANNILLTHFSARYPKMPPSAVKLTTIDPSQRDPILAVAFDQARMRIGDMWKMDYYLPAMEQSFLNAEEEDKDRNEQE